VAHRVQKGDMGLGTQGVKTAYDAISPPPKKQQKNWQIIPSPGELVYM